MSKFSSCKSKISSLKQNLQRGKKMIESNTCKDHICFGSQPQKKTKIKYLFGGSEDDWIRMLKS